MRKCRTDEFLVPVVSLVSQCANDVLFNWSRYLCQEFLVNCCNAQDETKSFHYAWLFLSIVLVAWELSENSHFPHLKKDCFPHLKKDFQRQCISPPYELPRTPHGSQR